MRLADIETLAANGHVHEALRHVYRMVEGDPNAVEALSLVVRLEFAVKDYEAALRNARRWCALVPESGNAWYVLGRILRATGDPAAAIDCFRRAISISPGSADFHVSLGAALRASGNVEDAIGAYRQALQLDPANLAARQNLANVLGEAGPGRPTGAAAKEPIPWANQARNCFDSGDYAGSLRAAGIGLEGSPNDPVLLHIAATAAVNTHSADLAAGHFERLAAVAPGNPGIREGLMGGFHLATVSGRKVDANRYATMLLRFERSAGVVEMLRRSDALVLSAIAESRAAIEQARTAYERALDELLEQDIDLPGDFRLAILPSFYLAYHGQCDRDLMAKTARLWRKSHPSLLQVAPHCTTTRRRPGRIRVGIISRFLFSHSIGKTTEGLLRHFDREVFEVFLLKLVPGTQDDTTRRMEAAADHAIDIPGDVFRQASAEKIAALELDVLFFQDIGMEPYSYFLAFSRLAPVQCVSFGHPNTTGIPTMDYFVSNDLYETEVSTAHYTESLFLLNDLPTLACYRRPRREGSGRSRDSLGLPQTGALYLCPQTLFKFHPDFDEILAGILARDGTGHIVLIRGQNLLWYGELIARMEAAVGAASRRIISVGMLPQAGFLDLLACCDVMIDTIHFNGMNSSLEAFSVGLPVVTLPTALQRGRHTQAMYRKMGITDCIARDVQDYIEIAVRLGTDPDFNQSVRRAIDARSDVLYEDTTVVREFERFFLSALAQKGIAV